MSDYYSPPPLGLSAGARTWAYLRDSGGPSQEKSVDQQEEETLAYCKRYNFNLVNILRDVARSAGSVVGRDEFMKMVELSEDKSIRPQPILIWNFARFARDFDDSIFYLSTLRRSGIIVHSLTDKIPEDPEMGRIIEFLIHWGNEHRRTETSRDVKRGLKYLVSKGFAPGTPPRGYIAVKVHIGEKRDHTPRIVSKWEPDPVLSEYVKIAWQLRAAGKSFQEITKATNGHLYTSLNSWHSFFRNKSYLGIGRSGDLEVPDHHEPLITWELWEAVQKIYDAHPQRGKKGSLNHPRRVGTPRILSGFTYCLECGAMMTHNTGHKKQPWHQYICGNKDRHGVTACKSRRVSSSNAETQTINTVLNKILTPEYLSEVIEETKKHIDSTIEIERQIAAEKRTLEVLDIAIQRTLNTIETTGSQAAQDRLKQREAEKVQTRYEINLLSLQLATAQTEITPEAMNIILAVWREQFNTLKEAGNIRDLKAWLMQFVHRIELGYNQARIFYTYPMTELVNSRFSPSVCGAQAKDILKSMSFCFKTCVPIEGMIFESPWGAKAILSGMAFYLILCHAFHTILNHAL